jgi:drug/metabolite transporter (DMT)-like permease
MTSAVAAGVIMASIPAAVAVMSWLFLRECISLRVWAAVAFAVAGISLVSLNKYGPAPEVPQALSNSAEAGRAWLGNLLLVAAVLCEAAYAVIGKKLTGALSPKRITALINLWGFALITPLGVWMAWGFDFASVATSNWLLLVFYAFAASVWTVWLWMTGLKLVPANQAGVFTVMLPISAALVGVGVLGESLSAVQLGAFALALAGVALATWPAKKTLPLQPGQPPAL